MTTLFKSIFSNKNFPISNSLTLNKYSIKNIIISPRNIENINTNENIPLNTNNNNYIILSPTKKRTYTKCFLSNHFNTEIPNQFQSIENITPLESHKNIIKLNDINLKIKRISTIQQSMNRNQKRFHISKVIKIKSKKKEKERYPQDSKNKSTKKLKDSISSRIFRAIKSTNSSLETINKERFPLNSLSKKKKISFNSQIINLEPKEKLNLKEFQFGEQIGNGTFGKIYSVKWVKNNKYYAMKNEILYNIEEVEKRRNICNIMKNYIKNTNSKGVINIYGNLCFKNNNINNNIMNKTNNNIPKKQYIYYELMEKAESDWNKEIIFRREYKIYYTEYELIDIMIQLITELSNLQKNHITHRDIKPQNILVLNGKYKLCDFGEIRVLQRDGLVVQRVRGSELYMSPILFKGLHLNSIQVKHNTYKSDVFSLGMCLFYAASLTYNGVDSIREINNMKKIENILINYLSERYSEKLIRFILLMLEIDESKRFNFIQLEEKLKIFNKSIFNINIK